MLLDFSILNKKRLKIINSEEIVDLTESTVSFNKNPKITVPPILITDELTGRPNLISKIIYRTESNLDLLCSFNGISNPLSIKSGDVIVAPDDDYLFSSLIDIKDEYNEDSNKNKLLSKLSKKDQSRIEKIKKDSKSNLPIDDIRTPNMVKANSTDVTAENGVIILGTNISDARCKNDNLSDTQKLTEQIRKALKDKIKSIKYPTLSAATKSVVTADQVKKTL